MFDIISNINRGSRHMSVFLGICRKYFNINSRINTKNLYLQSAVCSHSADLSNVSEVASNSGSQSTHQSEVQSLAKNISVEDMPVQMSNPYERNREVCILCKYGVHLNYKNPKLLSQFVSPFTGQVYDRHITRLCAKQQNILLKEIKKSVAAGYMPVMIKTVDFLKDPPLFDPNHPIRPHKW